MVSKSDINDVINIGKMDGARLFEVSEAVYRGLIGVNWVGGCIGVVYGMYFLYLAADGHKNAEMIALGTWAGTAVFCAIQYAVAVLSTHVAKVLVHILYSNIILIRQNERD